jgi:hypothetical protein
MKGIISFEDLASWTAPPGYDLRLDGRILQPAEAAAAAGRGEILEVFLNGARIGRIRPPTPDDGHLAENIDVLGDLAHEARRNNGKDSVNWLDESKRHFWCPECAKRQSKPGGFAAWVSAGRRIAIYAICRRCVTRRDLCQRLGEEEVMKRIINQTERRLVEHYPHLATNLDSGYFES